MDGRIRAGYAAQTGVVAMCRNTVPKAVPMLLGSGLFGCAIGAAVLIADMAAVRAQALEPGRIEFQLAQEIPATIEPGRIEKEFEENELPQSTFEPVIPEGEEAVPPSEAEEIRFVLSGVLVDGATAFGESEFLPLYEPMLGQEVSLGDIYRLAGKVSAMYRGGGYILSRALVPAQRIRDGLVRVQVLEGFINEVIVEGAISRRDSLLESYAAKIAAERPLSADTLERYLLLADDLPGVTAKAVLTPSLAGTPGASDLVLFVDQKDIDQAYSFDNRGSRFVGPFEGTASVKFNSLLGLYEQTTFRSIIATQSEELRFFQVSHQETLGSEGTKVQMSYNVTNSRPGFTFVQPATNVESTSEELTFTVKHPMIRSRSQNMTVNLDFTWRKSITDLAFTPLFQDRLRILRLGLSYDWVDDFRGINLVKVEASQGFDILNATESGSADGIDADISRENGKSDFFKLTADASRLQRLYSGVSLLISATGQFSGSQLMSSEEFGYGGSEFGRAFDGSEISGEHGAAGKLELQYGLAAEAVPVLEDWIKDFQVYSFFDYGIAWRIDPVAQDSTAAVFKHATTGSSAGAGVRFNISDNMSGYVELDKPLTRDVSARGTDGEEPRAFFALAARF
jgi:hemolysin activation/secretion protein